MQTTTRISKVIEASMEKVSSAASDRNISEVTKYTKIAEKAERLKSKWLEFEEELLYLEQSLTSPTKSNVRSLRHFKIRVTQGMINQNLLTLTSQVKQGLISIGEVLRIETTEGDVFKTDLMGMGNKLRERGQIRIFYEKVKIKPDDILELIEKSEGEWSLAKSTEKYEVRYC